MSELVNVTRKTTVGKTYLGYRVLDSDRFFIPFPVESETGFRRDYSLQSRRQAILKIYKMGALVC